MSKTNETRAFYKKDTPHGLVKRIMLKKYFQAYIEKTQSKRFTLDTVFIDGFAGEGRYDNDWPREIEKYGSPLIALMVVLGFYYRQDKSDENNIWGWPPSELDAEAELEAEPGKDKMRRKFVEDHARITLIFIESDQNSYRILVANVELLIIKFLTRYYPTCQYGYLRRDGNIRLDIKTGLFSLNIEIVNKRFAEYEAPMMIRDKSVRSLTFLDPYGFTQTPMSHVQQFVPGIGNEILINFMCSFVNRFVSVHPEGVTDLYGIPKSNEAVAKHPLTDLTDLEIEKKKKDDLVDFVKEIIHFCESEGGHSSNKINKCAINYEDFLKRKTSCNFSLIFEMKNKGNTALFHMVHVTNHIKGIEAMKESMNRCSQKEGEMVMSDYDILRKGQTLNLGNMDDPIKVARSIFSEFRGRKRVPLTEIEEYILLETPYLYRKKPIARLQEFGKIIKVVSTCGKEQERKNSFPDIDSKTKKSITWLVSFADEEWTADPEPDIKENVKKRKKKPKQVENKIDETPSANTCNKDEKNVLRDKAIKNKKKSGKQATKNLAGHSVEEMNDQKYFGLSIKDVNNINNGAESMPEAETTKASNDITFGATVNEQTDRMKIDKQNQKSRARQQTLQFKVVKGNQTEKIASKEDDKERRKRKLSNDSSRNENASTEKRAHHTLD